MDQDMPLVLINRHNKPLCLRRWAYVNAVKESRAIISKLASGGGSLISERL